MPVKILLDTDIGTDVDDAVCLAYLLSNPDCDLLGITTVTGEPEKRAGLASALCRMAGRTVPIYPGAANPLIVEQQQKRAEQAEVLSRWAHDRDFPRGEAVLFLRDTIRANPGEVMLLTIGPLTNIGLLFALDPDLPGLLKGLVMMAGIFSNRTAGTGPMEWNAMGDPHASAIVYGSRPPLHRSVGTDITSRVFMPADEARRRFDRGLLRPVLDMGEVWFRRWGGITFHDPLAAATIFEPEICEYERGCVEIELTSRRVLGMTHWTPQEDGPHQVASSVDKERFLAHYFSMFE